PEKSGLFLHLNRGKRSVTLNLRSESARGILTALAKWADILVEDFPPSFLPSLGLSYEQLERANPRLVMTSIAPFGQTGPYRDHKATEMGVTALSGAMYVHGVPEREPLRYPPDVVWCLAGSTAAAATTGALLVSRAQGIGQHVDVSALETVVGNVMGRPLSYEYSGVKSQRGARPAGYPQGAFPCQDGYVVFGIGPDRYFRRLCVAIGPDLGRDLLTDPLWATPEARAAHQEEFEAILLEWTMQRSKEDIFRHCQAHGVICAPIYTPEELLQDPQLRARGYFQQLTHPAAGRLSYPGAPFQMAETPWRTDTPAPLLGQHNREVYRDILGFSPEDLAHLHKTGAV
ncbi:MAG: CoA transferase, partial [Chloroflexi bacterium]|nr:CoA transferase [Chloroflexota bacterium]